jgi:hypothetical protein
MKEMNAWLTGYATCGVSCSAQTSSHHWMLYEIRPRKDHRGVDLISDALPFGRLWYGDPNAAGNAIEGFFPLED